MDRRLTNRTPRDIEVKADFLGVGDFTMNSWEDSPKRRQGRHRPRGEGIRVYHPHRPGGRLRRGGGAGM